MKMIARNRARTRFSVLTACVIVSVSAAISCASPAVAQEKVRVALPTKTYYPTIIAETALRQKFFAKEGITAELTVYRGGAEAFEAVAAGAADLTLGSTAIVAAGIKKGVKTKAISAAGLGYNGWYLMVKPDSPIKSASELEGKKVGITSAGSATDILARWTQAEKKVKFTSVPLGGGGLIPNLLSGNVDAIVLYSPLSYKVLQDKSVRPLIDYGADVPEHLSGVWIAPNKLIDENPKLIQKVNNALFGAMVWLKNKDNRQAAIKIISEIDEIPLPIAEAELDGNIVKLSSTGEMNEQLVQRGLDMAKLVGMTDVAAVSEIYTTKFKAVPTQ